MQTKTSNHLHLKYRRARAQQWWAFPVKPEFIGFHQRRRSSTAPRKSTDGEKSSTRWWPKLLEKMTSSNEIDHFNLQGSINSNSWQLLQMTEPKRRKVGAVRWRRKAAASTPKTGSYSPWWWRPKNWNRWWCSTASTNWAETPKQRMKFTVERGQLEMEETAAGLGRKDWNRCSNKTE